MLMKRTYLQTHPWIKFDLEADKFSPQIWMLLGEATSKAKHIGGVPLAPEAARTLYEVFLAKGALATTAIEGNTLTEAQVYDQVQGKLRVPPSQEYLKQEVQNIIDACNGLVADLYKNGPEKITVEFCCRLNAQVLNKLDLGEDAGKPGEIRRHNVVVGSVYKGAPAEDCMYLLEEMCSRIEDVQYYGRERHHLAILTALFAHIYMALIHPFGDGNGRTARLLEYYILLRAGFPHPTGHLLSNHYNQTRAAYYRELDKISKTGGDARGFVLYALQGFVDGLVQQINHIRKEQFSVAWVNYVHERFRGMNSASDHRRRELVLCLGAREHPVRVSECMGLTSSLAREYAAKTPKTLTRDLNALSEMGLIARLPQRRVRARTDIVQAFIPWHHKDMEADD